MRFGSQSIIRCRSISSYDMSLQDEPTDNDIEAMSRPQECLLWPFDSARIVDLRLPKCDDVDRVSLLRKAFAAKRKHLQRIDDDEPSIFDDESIASLDAVSLCKRRNYEERELAERKACFEKNGESSLPDHMRRWILTGEGVPTI